MTVASTASILSTNASARVVIVCAIEGYDTLLSDYDDVGAINDAWAATPWAGANLLSGLFVDWKMQQNIKPWDTTMDVSTVLLTVVDTDGTDKFGIDTHGARRGNATMLDAAINSIGTTVTVKSTAALSSPVWIGTERIEFSGSTATTLTGCTRGTYAPFSDSAGANQFGHNHAIPDANNIRYAQIRPEVATAPRTWIGRWVGAWLHVIVDGELNTKANAQLMFAGKIRSIRDADDGTTVVEVTEARQEIVDCTLLRDQYVGEMQEGIYIPAGNIFQAKDFITSKKASTLTVVTGAPASNYEMQEGLYSLSELEATINLWLQQAKTDGNLNLTWRYSAAGQSQQGLRGVFGFANSSAVGVSVEFDGPAFVIKFMGWGNNTTAFSGGNGTGTPASWETESPEEPYRILPSNWFAFVYIENTGGTWIDNTGLLPAVVQPFLTSTYGVAGWGVLKLSTGAIALAQKIGTVTLASGSGTGKTVDQFLFSPTTTLAGLAQNASDSFIPQGVRASESVATIAVSQTVVMEGPFCDTTTQVGLLTRMLTSTGVNNQNDIDGAPFGTDTLAEQLGCGMPQELLGTTWTTGMAALGAGQSGQGTLMMIDKPTKLWDLIKCELILRRMHLVWRNGTIQPVTWATPTAATAVWDLTEANKAVAAGVLDGQRVPTETTDEYVVNIIKISYNRLLDGTFRDTITIIDPTAMGDSGGTGRMITIEARNSWGDFAATGRTVEALAADVSAWLPLFSRPLKRLKRSLGIEHICTLAPADQANVTDNFARDPSTGVRGLSARPGLIISSSWDMGGPQVTGGDPRGFVAECDLLLLLTDRIATYSPCAEVDYGAAGGGYNAGTKVVTCKAHSYSLSSEVHDAARFAIGDSVRVVEQDPSNPAAPQTWTDIVANQSGDTITLTTGLAGFVSTKRYRIHADHYGACSSTQKAKVFQADDATDRIESVADSYQYGYAASHSPVSWPVEDPATPPALYSQYDYGDGYPLSPGSERDLVRLVNNLVNYRTAPLSPGLRVNALTTPAVTQIRSILMMFPIYIGPGEISSRVRHWHCSPFARNTHASAKNLYVSLCRKPPSGTSYTMTSSTAPEYALSTPYVQQTFTLAGSAGWAALSQQPFDARVCDQATGVAWVVVEGEGDATGGIQTRGISDCYLGPLEDS